MDLESFCREAANLANSLSAKEPTARYYLRCRVGPSSRRAVQVERKQLEPGVSEDDVRRSVEAMADTHGRDDACFFELLRTGWTSPELSTRIERDVDDSPDQADSPDMAMATAMVKTNDTLRLALGGALTTIEKQFNSMLNMVRTEGYNKGVADTAAELGEVAQKGEQFDKMLKVAEKWVSHGRATPGQALRSVDDLAEAAEKMADDGGLSAADRAKALALAERLAALSVKGLPPDAPKPDAAAGGAA